MKHCKITYFENNVEKTKIFETLLTYKDCMGLQNIIFNNKLLYKGTEAGAFGFICDNIDNYK